MTERRASSMGERWRRITSVHADVVELEKALASLPSLRNPRLIVQAGTIQAEMEGIMGSIHEVSVHVPLLPSRAWSQVVRVLRRSDTMLQALRNGLVPRSFDRLIARVCGEAVFPETRRVSSACTCREPEPPCRHILALQELFARRLEERAYELLVLRGVPLRDLLDEASKPAPADEDPLAFGAREEPVLFPEGEHGDLDATLAPGQVRALVGGDQAGMIETVLSVIDAYAAGSRDEKQAPPAEA